MFNATIHFFESVNKTYFWSDEKKALIVEPNRFFQRSELMHFLCVST